MASISGPPPDPFVSSAPLIVATECSDGIALLALHTSFAEEPLLLDADEMSTKGESSENTTTVENDATQNSTTIEIQDVPRSYRGPFRIHLIDNFGTSMVCAGWRSHAQLIVDYCRDLAKEEFHVYGPPRMSLTHCQEYGQYLAHQTSLWIAHTGVMKRHRWSCVGLLATCSSSSDHPDEEEDSKSPGCLWLVDKTGAYRVRAHAVGGGPLAGIVNQYLAVEGSKDNTTRTAEKALRDLIDFLSEQSTMIPRGTRAELGIITADSKTNARMKRVFISRLFATISAS